MAGEVVNLDGAVALVTGANRGLGRRLTEQLLTRGAKGALSEDRGVARFPPPRTGQFGG